MGITRNHYKYIMSVGRSTIIILHVIFIVTLIQLADLLEVYCLSVSYNGGIITRIPFLL